MKENLIPVLTPAAASAFTPEERRARRYAQSRRWAKENPEKTRAYGRAHYQRNTEARRAYSNAYNHAHKEERAAYNRAYYQRKRRNRERTRKRREMAAGLCPIDTALAGRLQESLIRQCRRTLGTATFTAMERVRRSGGDVDAYFARFPFEEYAEQTIKKRLAFYGIRPGNSAYDEGYDAGMLAYLYSMHRCAALACDYAVPYLRKMIRIYINCALLLSRDAENLCRINGFRVLRPTAGVAGRLL